MRKMLIAVMAMVTMLWFTTPTHATLWDRGGGLIYDDDLNITWLQNAGLGGKKTWYDAMAWANNLVYEGYDDWRLPTTPGTIYGYTNQGEMGDLYYTELGNSANPAGGPMANPGPFTNVLVTYWLDKEISSGSLFAWTFHTWFGFQDNGYNKYNTLSTWAVRDGDSAPVPIPGAVWLLGSGIVGLIGLKRRRGKGSDRTADEKVGG